MAAQIKQFSKRLSGTCLLALSVLMAIFGLSGLDGVSHKGLPFAPKTELVSNVSAARSYSYQQALADYDKNSFPTTSGKITVLAISRLDDGISKTQFIQASNRFLEVRCNLLLPDHLPTHLSYHQEAIAHS